VAEQKLKEGFEEESNVFIAGTNILWQHASNPEHGKIKS